VNTNDITFPITNVETTTYEYPLTSKRVRGFERVNNVCCSSSDPIPLPCRATKGAAGYDVYATEDMVIPPQQSVAIMTGIKAYMQDDEVLLLFPRSSTGIKKGLRLANSTGVGDSDFYNNVDNEGNYKIVLQNTKPAMEWRNPRYIEEKVVAQDGRCAVEKTLQIPNIVDNTEENTVYIKKGERVVQAIFMKVLKADNDAATETRVGGVGSTWK
jgi:dUTP pyrophosphatase